MKTVTYEEILRLNPWLEEKDGAERIKAHFDRFGGRMSALDILNLNDVSAGDKLWSVLREELIPAPILHEFGCVCAEYALSLIENPDPRSIKAIEVKRAWMRGEATDEELDAARDAAFDVACEASWSTTKGAACAYEAARAAWDVAGDVAWATAREAANDATWAADEAARFTHGDAKAAEAAVEAQVAYLIMALEETYGN